MDLEKFYVTPCNSLYSKYTVLITSLELLNYLLLVHYPTFSLIQNIQCPCITLFVGIFSL